VTLGVFQYLVVNHLCLPIHYDCFVLNKWMPANRNYAAIVTRGPPTGEIHDGDFPLRCGSRYYHPQMSWATGIEVEEGFADVQRE